MADPARGLESSALKLSRRDRGRLVQRLLSSLDQEADAGADQLWLEEAERRLGSSSPERSEGDRPGPPAERDDPPGGSAPA
ncbi:MAG: addiction module protein [Candidatus Rokubacteria bacterium]|nr:addiction module protein [Candidatus Rokubacteria bacterium]